MILTSKYKKYFKFVFYCIINLQHVVNETTLVEHTKDVNRDKSNECEHETMRDLVIG